MKITDKQLKIIETYGADSPESFLMVFPYRYERLEAKPFDAWRSGDTVVFSGRLLGGFKNFTFRKNQSVTNFKVVYQDEIVPVAIFNRRYLNTRHYEQGIVVVGVVGNDGKITAKTVSNKDICDIIGIKPIYSQKSGIKQYEIERLIGKIIENVSLPNIIPFEFQTRYKLMDRFDAVKAIHMPQSEVELHHGLRTLKYEEFLAYHLSISLNNSDREYGISKVFDEDRIAAMVNELPFKLTVDQVQSLNDILDDLKETKKMNRLLQGDVGSGKTIVAFLSAFACYLAGYQVAIMVPTELLLMQHVRAFQKLFPHVDCVVLSQGVDQRDQVLQAIATGKVLVVFGTHALFQKDVIFDNLGFVIIDEQHRFGVEQRRALIAKGNHIDTLMLSATPIPRTLAASLFFDLDVSTISTYPSHRKQIETHWIRENSLRSIMEPIQKRLNNHEQIYIVCAAIDEGERAGVKNVHTLSGNLKPVFANYNVDIVHGKMPSDLKNAKMQAFVSGEIDILISTSVIEVGLDVHNANMMIIYNAEQFGLATLHQLRGRVGRGKIQGVCYLLSGNESDETAQRMNALVSSHDGFELSVIDMRLRGFGDVLGQRQSGLPNFILGDIIKDENILKQAKIDALTIAHDLNNKDYAEIIADVARRQYFKTT
ncbi:ATP-dependent DNA helicase RecG [Erysipelothrix sp. strain 2 (EsS2-6-Brazil)]|uniref:ATP-dependent DNA helicase RecG n=1 Tax=Erysipelothrix sp. strain 2 (EsS2-6-Brazil) TaxID=2500549 RepID=UPI00190D68A5|nr:ATP-dependent DNA helicase RecG [Erysipelothrix sp. strain 2 (EsS2-6-Brazil)]MBK2403128.1 ATP-dependent DNA helicase RecG [Erysipelothrix sp. strain 2 (EsS2-6-Brazil)]